MKLHINLALAISASLLTASQAELTLTHVHPAGLQQGTNTTVKLTGKFAPWPCQVWVDAPGISFKADQEAGKFEVSLTADAKPGPHLFRVFDATQVSAPISLIVATVPQTLEVEPNDDFLTPQILTGNNVTINGRLDKADDVDSFQVALKQGQTAVIWMEAYVLAAGFDGMLRVVDARGSTLAFNHDGTTMDPFLVFMAPQDGNYVIQTMGQKYPASSEVRFAGGEDCIYRLHVSTEPYVRNTWPLAVPRGGKSLVMLEGWNLTAPQMELDAATPPPFPVTFSDLPELTESTEPQTLAIPSAVSGRIDPAGDEDSYPFTTTKDTALELTVTDPSNASPMDAWLKILNTEGKELASNDDSTGSNDPKLIWTAPADGTYTALVGELTQRGGKEFVYRLQISKAVPSVTATVADHAVKLTAGKSADLKVTVTQSKGPHPKMKLLTKNLPAGITAPEVDVPEKGGAVVISLTAEATAAAASQPFQLVLSEVESGREILVTFQLISTSENNGVPQGYRHLLIEGTEQLWLTVTPAAP
jgi:hypothetical protein